ncbi:hypothetical protein [Olleya sp. R77988]|uniref:hypothetical protein n=1 Tax=Olleya sp. R77988 TaxID=3093875 RepID=UPI0037CB1B3E
MKQEISIKKAILRGQLMVNVPVFIVLLGSPLLLLFIARIIDFPDWLGIIGVFLGIALAWLVWSILITKWRIWAFSKVRNVHELKRQAIQKKLIWEDGSSFAKTEYRTKKDKLILKKLEEKFNLEDVFEEDFSIPEETKIYFSFTSALFVCLFLTIAVIIGVFLMFQDKEKEFYIGFFLTTICLFSLREASKKLINRKPQLIINSTGITFNLNEKKNWSEIFEEKITAEGYGSSTKNFLTFCDDNYNYSKIEIDNFNISISKLENILRTYRIRFNKNNNVSINESRLKQ